MSGVTHLKSRKSTLIDRKIATPPDGEDFSLREDEVWSNDGTRESTRRHRPTLQELSSPPKLWSSKQMLTLAFAFIVPLAYCIKLNMDSGEHSMQLQLNNSNCLAKTHNLREQLDKHEIKSERMKKSFDDAKKKKEELQEKEIQCRLDSREQFVQLQNLKEKVDELNKELEQTTKRLSDTQKVKEELREKETQCRLDMKNAEITYAEEKHRDKEEYRSDTEERHRAERDKLEYENRLWQEETAWLIKCLGRQNTDQDGFILTRAFNAIVRAIKSGFGGNSDVENCLKMFSNRFQLRISA